MTPKWIQGMGKLKKGALHQQMGIPQGTKIPATKLASAAHSNNPLLRRRASLAMTFSKMKKS